MGKPRRPTPAPGATKRKGGGTGGGKKKAGGAGASSTKKGQSTHPKPKAKAKVKAAGVPAVVQQHHDDEEEYEVGEEDLAFVEQHAGFAAGFLDRCVGWFGILSNQRKAVGCVCHFITHQPPTGPSIDRSID